MSAACLPSWPRWLCGFALWALTLVASAAPSMVELIQRSKPSVVLVGTYAETDSPRFGFRGSGFVVGDGTQVLTNAHVLPSPATTAEERQVVVQVAQGDGRWTQRAVTVLRLDRSRDLALLRMDGPALPALRLAPELTVKEGMSVALIGFPIGNALGLVPVTHRGMIAAIVPIAQPMAQAQGLNEAAIRRLREGPFNVLQLDATAYPGNSGGPVLELESGLVVGIVNMVLVRGSKEAALSQPSGITYAIPSVFAERLLNP